MTERAKQEIDSEFRQHRRRREGRGRRQHDDARHGDRRRALAGVAKVSVADARRDAEAAAAADDVARRRRRRRAVKAGLGTD